MTGHSARLILASLDEDLALRDALEILRRQHHALRPVYALDIPPGRSLVQPVAQRYLVQRILRDPLIRDHPPTRQYERGFWKKVLLRLDDGLADWRAEYADEAVLDELEVDSAFSEAVADAMITENTSCSTADLPSQSFRTFVYDRPVWSNQAGEAGITLLEEQVAIQAGTTGLRTWTAALHLGHLILSDPACLFNGSVAPDKLPQVIELGAGTGFLSILLAQLGAAVIATDIDLPLEGGAAQLSPLSRLRHNVKLNNCVGGIRPLHLDWTDSLRGVEVGSKVFEGCQEGGRIILAADCIYDPDLFPHFVATLKALLTSVGEDDGASFALIASAVRNQATMQSFWDDCAENGLRIMTLATDPMRVESPTFWDGVLDSQCPVLVMRVEK